MMFFSAIFVSAFITIANSFPLERGKREPNGRAMTWSGWMPGGGMSIFASAADEMWGGHGVLRPSQTNWQDMGNNWNTRYDPPQRKYFLENDSPTIRPFDDNEDNFKLPRRPPFDDERERRGYREKSHSNKPRRYNDENEDEEEKRYSGSNANASFNAWFPIMFGMYPSETRKSRNNHNYDEEGGSDGRGLAAIANSVNHGRSGVASSHAVIYGGQPPRYNQNQKFYR